MKRTKILESVGEKDKTHLEMTPNGKWMCKKCMKEFYTQLEFIRHCSTDKHNSEDKKESKHCVEEYKVLSLIYSEEILGYSFRIKVKSKPKFRILNGLEQCVEGVNGDLYLVLRNKEIECYGFRLLGVEEIIEELTQEKYEEGVYSLNLYFKPKVIA